MKVVFLDVDGVLNAMPSSWDKQFSKDDQQNTFVVDPILVDRLYYILASTGARVVMSSTWRNYPDQMAYLKFKIPGLEEALVPHTTYWKTVSKFSSTRGQEIGMWLNDNGGRFLVTTWVVLDDDRDSWLEKNKDNWVNCNPNVGLTWADAEKAIEILGKV